MSSVKNALPGIIVSSHAVCWPAQIYLLFFFFEKKIVILAVVGCAVAQYRPSGRDDKQAQIVRQAQDVNPDGSYQWRYVKN